MPIIASQGGPKQHIARFKERGVTWLHVTASPEHARKAEAAGVDAVIAVGTEAGGHPPPDEVGLLVLVRAVVKSVAIPVIGGGGIADGAGIAAMFCLGADGVQLGTRFLMTAESNLHRAYKERALAAGIADTTLIGRGKLPIRVLKNDFTREFEAAERSGCVGAGLGDAQRQPQPEDGGVRRRHRPGQGRGRSKRRTDRRASWRRGWSSASSPSSKPRSCACPGFIVETRQKMSELLIEDRGAVRILTMNRPDKRNALNQALTQALLEGLRAAEADDGVRSIVLTGAGVAFCRPAPISPNSRSSRLDNAPLVERRAALTMELHGIFSQLSKPVVSAINGAAMGGGAGLALAGDVALMASSAKLGYRKSSTASSPRW